MKVSIAIALDRSDAGKKTGLGLAIASQIMVEKHGGAIDVNSEIGKGTEFVLTVPIC